MPDQNNPELNNLIKEVSEKLGMSPDQVKQAAQKGKLSESLKNLNANDAEKIKKVLSDKNAASKLLATAKAKKLLKNILGEK